MPDDRPLLTELSENRPPEGPDDIAYRQAGQTPVGDERTGTVTCLDRQGGVCYLWDEEAVSAFAASESQVGEEAFSGLKEGQVVRFFLNQLGTVMSISTK